MNWSLSFMNWKLCFHDLTLRVIKGSEIDLNPHGAMIATHYVGKDKATVEFDHAVKVNASLSLRTPGPHDRIINVLFVAGNVEGIRDNVRAFFSENYDEARKHWVSTD